MSWRIRIGSIRAVVEVKYWWANRRVKVWEYDTQRKDRETRVAHIHKRANVAYCGAVMDVRRVMRQYKLKYREYIQRAGSTTKIKGHTVYVCPVCAVRWWDIENAKIEKWAKEQAEKRKKGRCTT